MAVIATIAAGDVRRVLARGRDTVMARVTSTQYLGVIDSVDRSPQRGVMAVRALAGGRNVVCGFPDCDYRPRIRVAARTCRIREDKCAAGMALGTFGDRMSPIELEAGAEVVELRLSRRDNW